MFEPSAPPPSGTNYSAEHGCFEGPEKLLEIWFAPEPTSFRHQQLYSSSSDLSDDSAPPTPTAFQEQNLRAIHKSVWDTMLAQVRCTVVDIIHNQHLDAYLLSESSMFVYPHKIILKTCGTTSLLYALPTILEFASRFCNFHHVYRLFYSRKAFMFPEKQPNLHKSWQAEVDFLNDFFPDQGAAYVIGDTNSQEWHLYLTATYPTTISGAIRQALLDKTMSTDTTWTLGSPEERHYFSPHHLSSTAADYRPRDQTLEIIMTGLDPKAMTAFYQQDNEPAGTIGGQRVDRDTGLDKVHPDAKVNSYLFEPCGYSANAILDDGYYTIHVTPEPECSYASFESTIPITSDNYDPHSLGQLIEQVTGIFQPSEFTVTYFASKGAVASDESPQHHALAVHNTLGQLAGFKRKNKILLEFDGYDLVFGHYARRH
ncbi:S-adenosylmethionine decarboxylase [Hesseltinella vesiculosa]|uniref:adenosylmethionine decarboxylase n=1 Tax=Hesseltinella vesiculosa TaxID=101127 RepID=A0A1X2GH21_9FUNG|nr:S-adenosylmethionine decarboxylase [Hesseltinella vesiculosa]